MVVEKNFFEICIELIKLGYIKKYIFNTYKHYIKQIGNIKAEHLFDLAYKRVERGI